MRRGVGGKTARRLIRESKLSYEAIASSLGVHSSTVRGWEKKGMTPLATLAFRAVLLPHKKLKRRINPTIKWGAGLGTP